MGKKGDDQRQCYIYIVKQIFCEGFKVERHKLCETGSSFLVLITHICSRFAHEGNASRDLTGLISLIWTDFRNVFLIAEAFH